jgi:hypothetical protein
MISRLITCTALILSAFPVAAAEPSAPLRDQFGNFGGLGDHAGSAVLAIVTSTRKLVWIKRWEAAIRGELPELVSIRVADVADEPPPSWDDVAALLLKRAPPDVSVLIDMENAWASGYDLDTNEPCLLLFDSEHNVVATFRGRPKGVLVDEVLDALKEFFPPATSS